MGIDYSQLAIPKPAPRWRDKAKQAAEKTRQLKAAYAAVDQRDSHCCRVCHKRVGGIGMLYAAHHHHLQYRSKGGEDTTDNIVTLCVSCHSAQHNGEIRLSGNADTRNSIGVLNGVRLERATDAGWKVEGFR
jgi:5-methylcytosine-specific restriction endonuclease McrA